MMGDGDGTATSNGTSHTASNGPRAQNRVPVAAANGTHKAGASLATAAGGSSGHGTSQNGKEVARPAVPSTYFGHDREEVTRILIQALSDMGYHDAAESVSRSSGYKLESQAVADFRLAVLHGSWAEAERLLFGGSPTPAASTTSLPDRGVGTSGHAADDGLVLAPGADRSVMRFWLRQQKFLELLEERDTGRALSVLRNELTPLYQDTQKLHFLSSLLMCQSAEDLKVKAEWDGAQGHSREILLSELSRCISPSVMLPEHRLAYLLQQVKENQILNCLYHTTPMSPSLYSDHYCERRRFPTEVVRELDKSIGEIWQIRFSNDGTRLASSGSDSSVIVWDTTTWEVILKLDGHDGGAGNATWSPDDSMLVTCGRDRYARIWDSTTGDLIRSIERFDEPVSSCVWAADGQTIIVGTFDKERSLCQWNLSGDKVYVWSKKHRTEDLAVSADGHWLVAMDDQRQVHVYNFITRDLEYEFELKDRPMSISISQDSRFLLINTIDGEMSLYDIVGRGGPVQKYTGVSGGEYLIRSGFGGANESFVLSGSEDGKLGIWHKATGVQIFKVEAHAPRCNAVCWNPADTCMFASCGDDGKIKIWSNREHRISLAMVSKGSHHSNGTSRSWQTDLPTDDV